MIRVLEVLATLRRAGAETLVASLVSGLDRSRFEPAIVTLFDASPGDLEESVSVPVWRLGKRPGPDPRMFWRIHKVVRTFRPHIIHTHSYVMRYTLPSTNCASVHTVHNLASREVDRAGRLVHRAGFLRGIVPVAVADEVARSFESTYGFRPQVIRNGVDVARFYRPDARSPWRAAHGFRDDETLIVSVARLDPQKNPILLARALPENCRLLIAGEGSLRPELERVPGVHLLGVRSDLPELLSACDAFALASDWEGHPIAVMEAMAAGLPVAATAVGGVPEIVGDAGILVPPGDEAGMRDAIRAVLRDRDRFGAAARQRSSQFDIRRTVEAYSALFDRIAR